MFFKWLFLILVDPYLIQQTHWVGCFAIFLRLCVLCVIRFVRRMDRGLASLESNEYILQIEFVVICIYSKGIEKKICGCPALLMRKIGKIVCRVLRKRVKSKFLYHDADVVPLADKYIVLDAFSWGTITKFSWRWDSSLTTSRLYTSECAVYYSKCIIYTLTCIIFTLKCIINNTLKFKIFT